MGQMKRMTINQLQYEKNKMTANSESASRKPKVVPFKNVNLVEYELLIFLKEMRSQLAAKLCEKYDEMVIPMLVAAMLSVISIIACIVNAVWPMLFLILPVIWISACAIVYKMGQNYANKGLESFDARVELMKKALLRGTVGMAKRSTSLANTDPYQLIGTFYNELVGEEVETHITVSDKEMRRLYDMLETTGVLNDRHTQRFEETNVSDPDSIQNPQPLLQ